MTLLDSDPIPVRGTAKDIEAGWGDVVRPFADLTEEELRYLSTPQQRKTDGITSDYEPDSFPDPASSITVSVRFGNEGNANAEFEVSLQPFNPVYFDAVYDLFWDDGQLDNPPHVPFGLEWRLQALPDGSNGMINAPVLMFASPKSIGDAFFDNEDSTVVRGVSFGLNLAGVEYGWEPDRETDDFYNGVLKSDTRENPLRTHMFLLQQDQLHLIRGMELTSKVDSSKLESEPTD